MRALEPLGHRSCHASRIPLRGIFNLISRIESHGKWLVKFVRDNSLSASWKRPSITSYHVHEVNSIRDPGGLMIKSCVRNRRNGVRGPASAKMCCISCAGVRCICRCWSNVLMFLWWKSCESTYGPCR
ncbi:hypothetical protein AVEN_171727-1 [Araneus ventricosus]|uniref:Uncharacterized protein n=1 Tax=Araneus ventricosus TaxID=182803 RepID=A0A4Y2LKW1_ARAVE|nr:hypothetical protein AVEN_171727-1 [Araneus ventricosus]